MSTKITAEKLIEDRRGLDALIKAFEQVDLDSPDELTTFRNIINTYKSWAVNLSNDNIIDVARTIETLLGTDFAREQLMTYRVDHLRRLGIFEISDEELRKQKAERNRQRAMAKRIQMEKHKEDELRKAAAKNAADEVSEDEDMSENDSSDSS